MIDADPKILEEAMNIIARNGCERFTGDATCRNDPSRFRVAMYGNYAWCDGCIAKDALERFLPSKYA